MILETIIKTLITIIVLFLLTKLMGARQISQLTFYDYISGITIGSIAAEICISDEIPLYIGIISLIVWSLITLLLAIISNKSITLRKFLSGTPVLIMEKGEIIKKNLSKVKLDVNDLLRELRIKNYFDVSEIEYVYFESNGKISIIPYDRYKPTIKEDIKQDFEENTLSTCIIIDGNIIKENLKQINKNYSWLDTELRNKKTKKENILLALYNNNSLTIYKKK